MMVVEFASSMQNPAALKAISEGQTGVIVATDVLARGVDLPFVDVVVNFDVPLATRTYIHRLGRTARGGATGKCITLVLTAELPAFRSVVAKIDGSALLEATTSVERFFGPEYDAAVTKICKHKTRTVKAKYLNISQAEENEGILYSKSYKEEEDPGE
jgi:superfamily II DNA/RNA helicase